MLLALAVCLGLAESTAAAIFSGGADDTAVLLDEGSGGTESVPEGFTVREDGTAQVEYPYSGVEALVCIAVYDRDSGQMTAYGSADAAAGSPVTILLNGTVPEYYRAKAFFLEKESGTPLGEALETGRKEPEIACAALDAAHVATGIFTAEDGTPYESAYVDNQIIVVAADNVTQEEIRALVAADGGEIVGYVVTIGYYQVELPTPPDNLAGLNAVIDKWTASGLVEEAFLNTVTEETVHGAASYPNDPWAGADWSEDFPADGNWGFEAIRAASAQELLIQRYGSREAVPRVKVGVLDGCFYIDHPDLPDIDHINVIYDSTQSITPHNVADLAAKATDFDSYFSYVHGTHVAGTIAAAGGNGRGVTGIAVNADLECFQLRRADGLASAETEFKTGAFSRITAVAELIERNVKVINYSMGYSEDTSAARQKETAVKGGKTMGKLLEKYLKKGYDFVIVTSAGNGETANKDAKYSSSFSAIEEKDYPNAYARLIVVGASYAPNTSGTYYFVSTHNCGTRIDVTAPGMDILSCICQNGTVGDGKYNSFYGLASGTSMASPHVAGAAALLYEADRALSGAKVKQILLGTADIPVYGEDSVGNPAKNMINAARAVAQVLDVEYQVSSADGSGNVWTFQNGVLTITGSKPIAPLSRNGISYYPWCLLKDEIIAVDIGEGITAIGASAFDCMLNLEEVTLPETLTEIGDYAFNGCRKLEYLAVPPSVISIGECAIGYDGVQLPGFILYGYPAPSASQQYALENDVAFVDLSEGTAWRFDEDCGKLTLIGFGPMTDYENTDALPWYEKRELIQTIAMPRSLTSVGNYAFYGCGSLTEISLPGKVTSIGASAFYDCAGLTEIVFPDSLTAIGQYAFYGCGGLAEFAIPDGLTSLGDYAFSGCTGPSEITIPDGLTSIGEYAFENCAGLTGVTLPDSMTVIPKGLFSGTGLTKIDFPESVTDIRGYAFAKCTGLTEVTVPGNLHHIGSYVFQDCTGLTRVTLLDAENPDNYVNSIATGLFSGCANLKDVNIPAYMAGIGREAFRGCSGLTEVTIPDTVVSIGSGVFRECSGLTEVTIPDAVVSIGSGVFRECSGLTAVTIPDSVTNIPDEAFYGCSGLTEFTIPATVTRIGSYVFQGCSGLTEATIPSTVATIGSGVFRECSGLKKAEFLLGITSIESYMFYNCSSLTLVTFPGSVTEIKEYAFYGCNSLTEVTIPSCVTSIGSHAFRNCTALAAVTIPDSVTNIGNYVFSGCTSLQKATLPTSLTSLGSGMFMGCTSLAQVTIPSGVTTIGDYAFQNCTALTAAVIPDGVTSIGHYAFEKDTGLLEVALPNSVTSIGQYAFSGCTGLTEIILPAGLTTVGRYAFYNCSSLTEIAIPEGIDTIEAGTFYGCKSLKSVSIPSSVTAIGSWAFYKCASLTDVYYGGSEADWSNISIGSGNSSLTDAAIHCISAA